ncbi:lantibiotic immunity ABC transporter MutG family permease subunit [Lactobacillus helsingborgensis]|uniref:lantibiotic immunity ABC transporter MutG family permease subunit n=1 Tax=Lactobacillus helsingborgensis TaxID=1218494 RepID=UPI00164FB66D|nr:lantibiotic immunity ABC transporter MutG family permease subunit [Lactobacillus helsingborgensis]MBC6356682.1 lantibiotic immunity ABC transporter MutG family permease subunit [Lactobacillus helsingborgensis]
MLKRIFYAESIKLHRSTLLWLHIIALIIFPVLFGCYYGSRKNLSSSENMISMFITFLALASPLVINIIVCMVYDREGKAGNFKNWLTEPMDKGKIVMGQLIYYWLLYAIEIIGMNLIYYLTLTFGFKVVGISFIKLLFTSIALALFGLLQYELAELFAMKWNIGGSLVLGFFGSIISILGVTSLFDFFWPFIPWAWQSRLIIFWLPNISIAYQKMAVLTYIFLILVTIVLSLIITRYFNHWQGKTE